MDMRLFDVLPSSPARFRPSRFSPGPSRMTRAESHVCEKLANGQRPELPVHADGYTKGVRQAAFFLGCSDEPGQRIGFGLSGVFGSCRPLFGLTNRLLRRSDNLHRCRQIEIRAFQNGALVEPAEVGSEVNTAVALSLVAASHFRISSLKEMYSFASLLSRASSKIVSPTSPVRRMCSRCTISLSKTRIGRPARFSISCVRAPLAEFVRASRLLMNASKSRSGFVLSESPGAIAETR